MLCVMGMIPSELPKTAQRFSKQTSRQTKIIQTYENRIQNPAARNITFQRSIRRSSTSGLVGLALASFFLSSSSPVQAQYSPPSAGLGLVAREERK